MLARLVRAAASKGVVRGVEAFRPNTLRTVRPALCFQAPGELRALSLPRKPTKGVAKAPQKPPSVVGQLVKKLDSEIQYEEESYTPPENLKNGPPKGWKEVGAPFDRFSDTRPHFDGAPLPG